MHLKPILASGATAIASCLALIAVPAAVAGSTLPKVSVRVEGKTKNLLPATVVQPVAGKVRKDCSSASGAGAFNLATKGKWSGAYSKKYGDFQIEKILGETDDYTTTKSYWEIFVNNVAASSGACGIKLKKGESILFAAVGNTEKPGLPLGVTVSGTTAKVVYYTAKGKAVALAGATVKSGTSTVKTNAAGKATLPAYSKPTTVAASKTGYIRAEAVAS
jgi:Domain of unknown function (DUF4430)